MQQLGRSGPTRCRPNVRLSFEIKKIDQKFENVSTRVNHTPLSRHASRSGSITVYIVYIKDKWANQGQAQSSKSTHEPIMGIRVGRNDIWANQGQSRPTDSTYEPISKPQSINHIRQNQLKSTESTHEPNRVNHYQQNWIKSQSESITVDKFGTKTNQSQAQ